MSLIISFIPEFKEKEPNAGLFGFENWRKTLWGSYIIQELGCEIIASLKTTDIFAINEDLSKLKIELIRIRQNISNISKSLQIIDSEDILFRIENALEFISIAENTDEIYGISIS
ncbi:MAG: hypothetical protein ACI8RP_001776 [Urechidicola sp.]|jgi:hypothetical protein